MRILFFLILILCSVYNSFSQILSVSDQREDIDYICRMVRETHPQPFRFITEHQFVAKADSIKQAITEPQSPMNLYLQIAPLIASIKDGHCNMDMPVEERMEFVKNGGKVMPLAMRMERHCILVDYTFVDCGLMVGDTVVSINGISATSIADKLYALNGAELTEETNEALLDRYMSILLWMIYGWSDSFTFEVLRNGSLYSETLDGVTNAAALRAKQKNKKNSSFLMELMDEHTARIVIPNFYQLNDMRCFCDSVCDVLTNVNIKTLYIDVKGNGGGSSDCITKLLDYIPHPDYEIYRKSEIKISDQSLLYYKTRHPEVYETIKDSPLGSLADMNSKYIIPSNMDNPNLFRANIIVLVDSKTYSAASTFAHIVSRCDIGRVEGSTGCPPVYTGNFIRMSLPHSGLICYIPICLFYE